MTSLAATVLGLPFERALFWHKAFVAATIATGFVHGAVAIGYDGMTDDFVT
jgi:hypothetical protein